MAKKIICFLLSLLCISGLCPVISSAADYSLGDVNSDGQVSAIDASDILAYYSTVSAGGEPALVSSQKTAADVNNDDIIDASDASTVLAYYSYISTNTFKRLADYIIESCNSSASYNTYYRSKTYLLYDLDEEKLINYHDIHTRISPASFTKLLTAAVVLKNMNTDTVVTVGTELSLVQPYSSLAYLAQSNRLTVRDLLTGMLLNSGNDAAYTAAVATARSVSGQSMTDSEAVNYICKMMNQFAAELGMTESNFNNPDGYDQSGLYTTAADMLKLTRYCLTVPTIREITSTAQKRVTIASGQTFNWKSTNYLLDTSSKYYRADATGVKTGTTADAGTCLISSFKKNGKTYVIIVSGCSSDTTRYDLTLNIINTYT